MLQRKYKTNVQQKRDQLELLLALYDNDHVDICNLVRQGYWLEQLDPYQYIGSLTSEHFDYYYCLDSYTDLMKIIERRDRLRISYFESDGLCDIIFKFL